MAIQLLLILYHCVHFNALIAYNIASVNCNNDSLEYFTARNNNHEGTRKIYIVLLSVPKASTNYIQRMAKTNILLKRLTKC